MGGLDGADGRVDGYLYCARTGYTPADGPRYLAVVPGAGQSGGSWALLSGALDKVGWKHPCTSDWLGGTRYLAGMSSPRLSDQREATSPVPHHLLKGAFPTAATEQILPAFQVVWTWPPRGQLQTSIAKCISGSSGRRRFAIGLHLLSPCRIFRPVRAPTVPRFAFGWCLMLAQLQGGTSMYCTGSSTCSGGAPLISVSGLADAPYEDRLVDLALVCLCHGTM
jgi:hypothetical protein